MYLWQAGGEAFCRIKLLLYGSEKMQILHVTVTTLSDMDNLSIYNMLFNTMCIIDRTQERLAYFKLKIVYLLYGYAHIHVSRPIRRCVP